MLFEICITTPAAAQAATRAGAHRLELCSGLDTGGLTPSAGLIRRVRALTPLPVQVLIRTREGGFVYSAEEKETMLDDIAFCVGEGAGPVVGALDDLGRIDRDFLRQMLQAARGQPVTFHRAFDLAADPFEALEALIELGVPRVLTSGQAPTAWEGRGLLARLVRQAAGRIAVMPGSGIRPANIRALAEATGAREFHFSGREKVPGNGRSLPGLDDWYWESSEKTIREVIFAGP
jgi:copper homeostasis protein